MILTVLLMLAAADAAPERPAKPVGGVTVHRTAKKTPESAPQTPKAKDHTDDGVRVHSDAVPESVEAAPEPEAVTEYHSNPVFSADIAFQRCIEREAETAAKADMPFADFKRALPNLCVNEESRLAQRYADSRVTGDPMKQVAGVPRSKSRALVFDYTEGLRGIAEAGYINLTKSRAPMRFDRSLADWKPR